MIKVKRNERQLDTSHTNTHACICMTICMYADIVAFVRGYQLILMKHFQHKICIISIEQYFIFLYIFPLLPNFKALETAQEDLLEVHKRRIDKVRC